MKTKLAQLLLLILIGVVPAMGQSSDKKAEKERKKLEKEKEVATLVESKNFEFKATRALPTGFKSMDLTTNPNYVKFSPDLIVSEMPFYGKAYSVPYGGDSGLKFDGKPDVYKVEKKNKNYEVEAKVKGKGDFYTISLTISFSGNSTMNIMSNNRSSISYIGEVYPIEKPKEQK